MTKINHLPNGELSYYRLSLLSYLLDSHPVLATNPEFITVRAEQAKETYSNVIHAGRTHIEAEAEANTALFNGLHFSLYNTIVNIILDEFENKIPEDYARRTALIILPHCDEIISKYNLSDDFINTSEYDLLYTELVGTIQILLENDGVQ